MAGIVTVRGFPVEAGTVPLASAPAQAERYHTTVPPGASNPPEALNVTVVPTHVAVAEALIVVGAILSGMTVIVALPLSAAPVTTQALLSVTDTRVYVVVVAGVTGILSPDV